MRLICLFLLLANFLYFAYGQYFAGSSTAAPVVAGSDQALVDGGELYAEIVLLSEVDRDGLRALQDGGEVVAEILPVDLAEDAVADLVANPILVERLAVGEGVASELSSVDASVGVDEVVTDGLCVAIGPFDDLFKGQDANERLVALGYQAKLKALDIESDDKDYRVMFPPAKSAANAFRRLRELKAQKIDSYVITKGKDAMAISLGVFSTKAAAIKLQREIEKRGYQPVLTEIKKYQRRYWIYGSELLDLRQNESLWASIVAVSPLLSEERRPCPD